MALTVATAGALDSNDHYDFSVAGQTKLAVKKITFDSSYATGGETIAASDFGLQSLNAVFVAPAGGYVFEWTGTTIKAYRQKDPADTGGADIALVEVASAVNLSAISTYAIAFGH